MPSAASTGLQLSPWDAVVFFAFIAAVVGISLYASRKEASSEDYFLAGRKLVWPLIGFSLIASNISTEHFVGMAGSAFGRVGLAIASYEWMAAVTLILVAWWFLPKFLQVGIYTMPEFLEYRYDLTSRTLMAVYLMVAYMVVLLATVLYSGALALNAIFDVAGLFESWFNMPRDSANFWANVAGIWGIGIIAGAYTIYGGLKAVVWSDLLQGGALLIGGTIVTLLGLSMLGDGSVLAGWQNFTQANEAKLHTVLPWNDPDVPWLAVFVGGLWIPNLFYWGMNQFITQRTLGAKSLAEGQKGILLAAAIKLAIPFIIVIPGIMAYQLYGPEIEALGGNAGDKAYPYMISRVLPPQLRGVMFAALCGAVMSTFNSGLNSASTIFTIDLYRRYLNPQATPRREVFVGRISTAVIVVLSCLWAPVISNFQGVFAYIQEIWGFITPGIVAAFLVGLLVRRTPALAARCALLLGPPLYAFCRFGQYFVPGQWVKDFNSWAFLHHMGLLFVLLAGLMLLITWLRPRTTPVQWPSSGLDVKPYRFAYPVGGLLIAITAALYIIFW
jgi:SSS family solute:Na+ symporter